jgi:hypothetical protein
MKNIFFLLFLFIISLTSYCQKVGINFLAGTSNYEGDLQDKFFTFSQPRFAFGAGVSYKASPNISLRAGITFAGVAADDRKNAKVAFRNLNFKSPLTEFHIALEYYLFDLDENKFSPYFFGGLAVYNFNPYTYDTLGVKYFLRPLSTEGEGFYQNRKEYSLTQFSIPFGGGVKFVLSDKIRVGIEVGLRKLFTDYLDDVSTDYIDPAVLLANRGPKAVELAFRGGELKTGATYPTGFLKRGEPKNKDWYYFTGVTLSFRLPGRGEIDDRWIKNPRAKNTHTGCPKKVR